MFRNAVGGPAAHAGPRLFRAVWVGRARRRRPRRPTLAAALGALAAAAMLAAPARALDWIPPRAVTASLPGATLAPSSTHALELFVRSNGPAVNLNWSATTSGQFLCGVSPPTGSLSVPANGAATATLSVTLPDTALGIGAISVTLTRQSDGARAAKVEAAIYAATGGRPEITPVPGTWQAPAGTAGSVSFEIHSLIGSTESVVLTTGRYNPDPNNQGALFAGDGAPAQVSVPAGGTVTVSAPTTIAPNAYGGNLNAVQVSVTSDGGIATATGYALASAPLPGSLPTALYPVGLAPLDEPAAGRDGAALLESRGYWLVPAGAAGVRVLRTSSTDSIGAVDANGDGGDDRWIGTIRIPSFAAALDVVPGFVAASGDTLDVGLLAAGRAGLMLLDLREVEDPVFGTWSDFYDVDGNGVDDRILRTIPLGGFATDAAWFRAPSGRVVALVADADTGSVPVSLAYDAALAAPGTGAGVVAVDLAAALDSLGPVPYAAGALATPGSALDVELRGGSTPTMAVADGAAGVAAYTLSAAGGAPATVTFTPLGTASLSSAWGTPYARDLAWVPNTKDSLYVGVGAGAGGLQIVRVGAADAPALVLVQQTAAPAIGIAGAWTGTLAASLGAGGVALFAAPGGGYLDQILPAAPPPYTAPVTLAQGAAWPATGAALGVAAHQAWSSGATSLRFENLASIPDLFVGDGGRALVLRPGLAAITGVEPAGPSPPRAGHRLRLTASPNPARGALVLEARAEWAGSGGALSAPGAPPSLGATRFEVFDLRGRLVRRLAVPAPVRPAPVVRITWDGRDDAGRRVASGRYWARAADPRVGRSAPAPILILR